MGRAYRRAIEGTKRGPIECVRMRADEWMDALPHGAYPPPGPFTSASNAFTRSCTGLKADLRTERPPKCPPTSPEMHQGGPSPALWDVVTTLSAQRLSNAQVDHSLGVISVTYRPHRGLDAPKSHLLQGVRVKRKNKLPLIKERLKAFPKDRFKRSLIRPPYGGPEVNKDEGTSLGSKYLVRSSIRDRP